MYLNAKLCLGSQAAHDLRLLCVVHGLLKGIAAWLFRCAFKVDQSCDEESRMCMSIVSRVSMVRGRGHGMFAHIARLFTAIWDSPQ